MEAAYELPSDSWIVVRAIVPIWAMKVEISLHKAKIGDFVKLRQQGRDSILQRGVAVPVGVSVDIEVSHGGIRVRVITKHRKDVRVSKNYFIHSEVVAVKNPQVDIYGYLRN